MNEIEKYMIQKLDTRFIKGKAMFRKKEGNTLIIYKWKDGLGYEANYKCLPYLDEYDLDKYINTHFEVKSKRQEYCLFHHGDVQDSIYEIVHLSYEQENDLEILKNSCSEEDISVANILIYDLHPIGIYLDNQLVGVCSVVKENHYYDIGVLVHPMYRNRSIGSSLVKEMVKWIKENNGIGIYRVDKENDKSLRTAYKVGFKDKIEISIYELEK